MLRGLSTLQKTALLIGVPTTGVLLYILFRKHNEEDEAGLPPVRQVVSGNQTVIEVIVPREAVSAVIGSQGSTIKGIEERTGARVNFKDEVSGAADHRVVLVRGTPSSAQQAELEVKQIVAAQPPIIADSVTVPDKTVGCIIGRNGDNIREMCRISRCKINVPRTEKRDPSGTQTILLQGTPDAVSNAKSLIRAKLEENEAFHQRSAVAAANRPHRKQRNKHEVSPPVDTPEVQQQSPLVNGDSDDTENIPGAEEPTNNTEENVPNGNCTAASWPTSRGYLEVYVSAVENAGHFWVQVLGAKSSQLDTLITEMTLYYDGEAQTMSPPDGVGVGDMVAAPFTHDTSWYRAKVLTTEGTTLHLYYVDFGDSEWVEKNTVRSLKSEFLRLPYQASECYLANVKPANGDSWSDEASDLFEDLSHAARWKILMARTVTYRQSDEDSIPCIELVDTNGKTDVNVAEELVSRGFAEWSTEDRTPTTASRASLSPGPGPSPAAKKQPPTPTLSPKRHTKTSASLFASIQHGCDY